VGTRRVGLRWLFVPTAPMASARGDLDAAIPLLGGRLAEHREVSDIAETLLPAAAFGRRPRVARRGSGWDGRRRWRRAPELHPACEDHVGFCRTLPFDPVASRGVSRMICLIQGALCLPTPRLIPRFVAPGSHAALASDGLGDHRWSIKPMAVDLMMDPTVVVTVREPRHWVAVRASPAPRLALGAEETQITVKMIPPAALARVPSVMMISCTFPASTVQAVMILAQLTGRSSPRRDAKGASRAWLRCDPAHKRDPPCQRLERSHE
jgi:hypothetical protein